MLSSVLLLLPALALASPVEKRASPVEVEKRLDTTSAPSPDQIVIKSVSFSGTGCPQGTVSTTLDETGTVVTFGFDSFVTYIGPGSAQSDKSKACQLHLDLKYPGGFQYAVVDAVYHGYARLDAGVTGTFLSTYYFSQNAAQTTTTRSTISGAGWLNGNVYTKEDQVPSTAVIWSPCGANGILNVNNRISLAATNSKASGELSDDDATVSFDQQLHVAWQPCTSSGTGGGTFTTGGGSTAVTPREAEAEAEAGTPDDVFTLYPGTTTVTPAKPGGGSVVVVPGSAGGGSTLVKPGKA